LNKLQRYWFTNVSEKASIWSDYLDSTHSRSRKLVVTAFLGALAAVFQAAGGFLPGVGYLLSPFATAPIALCSIHSIKTGIKAYLLTITLLFVLQPSELIVFPFTTGLLGLAIGAGMIKLKRRIMILSLASLCLCLGILFLLYVVQFPVLGPVGSSSFDVVLMGYIYLFCFIYSWIWVDLTVWGLKKLTKSL
jgi:hypothetical protein